MEFIGELSQTSKNYLIKRNAFEGLIVSLLASAIWGVIIIIIALLCDLWIITWFFALLAVFILLATMAPYIQKKKSLVLLIPDKIEIKDEFIGVDYKKRSIIKPLSKISKVIDNGQWYFIKFQYKIGGILCQKDLITKGTIEDFEALFADKIVRKIK